MRCIRLPLGHLAVAYPLGADLDEIRWAMTVLRMGPMPLPDLEQQVRKAARERLEKTKTELVPKDVTCRTVLRDGVPWSEISSAAVEEKADLIVIATHGYTGLKHALLGSQAERVVRTATCPVLTVPAAAVKAAVK